MSVASLPAMRRVEVRAPSLSYEVVIGSGTLARVGEFARAALARPAARALVVADESLPARLIDSVRTSLGGAGLSTTVARVAASEAGKSPSTVEAVLAAAARARHERSEPFIALGGGITGDIAGFAGATYRRGVPWINCPTSLLAMVDASIGGKTGVNLRLGDAPGDLKKNMVGAFHQPRLVVADVDALRSLPDRELRCGLAECVKHGLLSAEFGDAGLLDWTEANVDRFLSRDADGLIELVARNVTVKAAVVEGDEREEADDGGRALLNLGHTFGHAIETLPGLTPDGDPSHSPLKHGEAVALGLIAACRTAEALQLGPASIGDRVRSLLARIGLPTTVAGLPDDAGLLALMAHDKKARAGRMRLILPCGPGRCRVVEDAPSATVAAGLDAIRA